MKTVTVKEMREIDRQAIEEFGIPSIVLMENAGRSVAEEVKKLKVKSKRLKNIGIFCGGGNNGGDGFVCARHLVNFGFDVEIFLLKKEGSLSRDAKINFVIVKEMRLPVKKKNPDLEKFDIIVDALLGTGTKGEIKGIYRNAIETINNSKKPVIAIDIPSGLDADTGKILGTCVKAGITVTMGFPKKGFFTSSGKKYVGKLVVADIGIPKIVSGRVGSPVANKK